MPGDDGSLDLTAEQRAKLDALQRSLTRPAKPGTRGPGGGGTRGVGGPDLPPCPLGAPPKPITTQLDAVSGDLYLRCLHTVHDPGPHCWDLTGKRRDGCP